ncbi:MAG TPA: FAD-binding protein [Patescibacteria group bacterium]|nr:FAD-binding protein [Patescibacteria group bacterium]
MGTALSTLETALGQNKIKTHEPLAAHTSLRIGGPAEYFVALDAVSEIVIAVKTAYQLELPVLILGGGSNILVSEKGISGLVIKNSCRKIELLGFKGKITNRRLNVASVQVFAESGAIMNQLVRFTLDQGLSGLEYQLGLPGTIGGGIFMNASYAPRSAYVGDHLASATLLSPKGEVKEVGPSYFRFSDDASVLQITNEILLSATFLLTPFDKDTVWQRGKEAVEHRTSSQPKNTVGVTFRNTTISNPISSPQEKFTAEYLIEKAGLKGKRIGDAMIAQGDTHFIVNCGSAKAEHVSSLLSLAKQELKRRFGVELKVYTKVFGI